MAKQYFNPNFTPNKNRLTNKGTVMAKVTKKISKRLGFANWAIGEILYKDDQEFGRRNISKPLLNELWNFYDLVLQSPSRPLLKEDYEEASLEGHDLIQSVMKELNIKTLKTLVKVLQED